MEIAKDHPHTPYSCCMGGLWPERWPIRKVMVLVSIKVRAGRLIMVRIVRLLLKYGS